MAIVNRDKDASEQKEWLSWSSAQGAGTAGGTYGNGYVATGSTLYLFGPMPYPYTLMSMNAVAPIGVSGAMELIPLICRPVSGGFTNVAISISNLVIVPGISFNVTNGFGYSGLVAAGSTLLNGQRGDIIAVKTAVANTAVQMLLVNAVIKKTQDIVAHNGIST